MRPAPAAGREPVDGDRRDLRLQLGEHDALRVDAGLRPGDLDVERVDAVERRGVVLVELADPVLEGVELVGDLLDPPLLVRHVVGERLWRERTRGEQRQLRRRSRRTTSTVKRGPLRMTGCEATECDEQMSFGWQRGHPVARRGTPAAHSHSIVPGGFEVMS